MSSNKSKRGVIQAAVSSETVGDSADAYRT